LVVTFIGDDYKLCMKIERLSTKTRKMLSEHVPSDLAVSTDSHIVYLTNVFKNGYVMGWYSHSPWGCVHDREQGWCLFNEEMQIIDEVASLSDGMTAGEDVAGWKTDVKQMYGRSKRLLDEGTLENIWCKGRDS
jgi:hypothetical protein